ncbi:MAG: ABC transporter substrate-binding protein, partial [Dongiaceae bacterium]
ARPGGNITGAFLDQPALTRTWLELVRAIVPQASRIAVLWDPTTGPALLRAIESAARSLAIQTRTFAAPGPDYVATFRDMAKTEPQALVLLSSPLIFYHRLRLAELASQARLPTIAMFKAFAAAGGLIACGPDPFEIARRSASQAHRILKGQRPGDIPIDVQARFELVINVKTAAMLGVPMPLSLLSRADQVIE